MQPEWIWTITHLGLKGIAVPFPQLALSGFLFLFQIGELLNLGFVEPVYNGVFSLLNMYALNLMKSQSRYRAGKRPMLSQ